jgi:hypothetical protein
MLNKVDTLVFLMSEISILKSRVQSHDSGHLNTAISVLQSRVEEVRKDLNNSIILESTCF